MFQLENVQFSYAENGASKFALDGVTLQIPSGQVTAILGLSGSGKTTLLNLLGLLCGPDQHRGSISYNRTTSDQRSDAELRRDDFGFVLQSAYMLPHFTCGENVGMPLRLQGVSPQQIEARVGAILQLADPTGTLYRLRDRRAGDVSGGERQRMAVLRAVIHDPRVLFADEPCSSLDPLNAGHIRELIRRWKRGELLQSNRADRTLLLVTHDIQAAWEEAENFVVLRSGQTTQPALLTKSQLSGIGDLRGRMMPTESSEPVPQNLATTHVGGISGGDPNQGTKRRFFFWFAQQNLWEQKARRSTWTNIFGLAVVAAFILLTFGLVLGVREARKDQLRKDPLNLCLWIGSHVVETPIDSDFIAKLENEIRTETRPEMLLGIHPFSQTLLQIYESAEGAGDGKAKISMRVYGRTLSTADPMLRSVKLEGPVLSDITNSDNGIVVSRSLLNLLGFRPEQSPTFVEVTPHYGVTVKVPVLGIAEAVLPLNHNFVIGENYFERFLELNANPITKSQRIGPIPKDWPTPSQFPPAINDLFGAIAGNDGFALARPLEEINDDGSRTWLLQHNGWGDAPHLSEMRMITKNINAKMKEQSYTDAPALADFSAPETDESAALRSVERKYDYAGIYFRDIDALEPANKVCEKYGLSANRDLIAQLVAIGGQTKAVLMLILILGGVFGLVVLSFMALLQVERNEKKTGQFGMLKAIGMPPGSLAKLALTESAIIWGWGTLLGLGAAAIIGPLAAMALERYGMPAKFIYWWPLFLIAPLCSFAVCILSNFVATAKSRNAPASESLRAG